MPFSRSYNYDKIEQENRAGDFSEFVYNIEQKTNNNQTVVVGDFNMNPFDPAWQEQSALTQ